MTNTVHDLDDIQAPRPTSAVTGERFPYGWPGIVCYIELRDGESTVGQVRTRDGMEAAIERARAGASTIYAVWPGRNRSDLFVIDDLDALAAKTRDTRKPRP